MHCMQSIPELCLRIACIVGFLMHTMHTSRMSRQFAMIVECDGDCDLKERAMKLDGIRECLKSRTVEDVETDSIKKK